MTGSVICHKCGANLFGKPQIREENTLVCEICFDWSDCDTEGPNMLSLQEVSDKLETIDLNTHVYFDLQPVQRFDNGPAVLNAIAFEQNFPNSFTVQDMLVAISDIDGRNLLAINGKAATEIHVHDDGVNIRTEEE